MRVYFKRSFFLCVACFLLTFTIASGQIMVEPMILNFTAKQPLAQNVLVRNAGKQTAYVDVTPYVVMNPGTANAKKIRVYNPKKSGILVYPSHIIIPAHQQRYVRIMLTKPLSNKERIYRVSFMPKIAGLNTIKKLHGHTIGLHLIIGYGILVNARPIHAQPKLRFKRKNDQLTITNVGNSNILITKIKQCSKQHKCLNESGHRLYAGNHWTIKLPYQSAVQIDTEWNEHYRHFTIKQ